MAKKIYVGKLMDRDRKAFTALSKTGHCTREQLNTFIRDGRIKNFVKDGYIKKETFSPKTGAKMEAYKLTVKGKNLCTKEWGLRGHYIAQSLPHDLTLSCRYFSLTDSQRETWKTESQLREGLIQRIEQYREVDPVQYHEYNKMIENHKISVPDCTYSTIMGTDVAFEVVTNSYGQAEIQAKQAFVRIMELKLEIERG